MLVLIGPCQLFTLGSLTPWKCDFSMLWLPVDNSMLNTSVVEIGPTDWSLFTGEKEALVFHS